MCAGSLLITTNIVPIGGDSYCHVSAPKESTGLVLLVAKLCVQVK